MRHTLTRIIDFFRIDPTFGWDTIDLDLTMDDLIADLDPGWSDWTASHHTNESVAA